MAILRKKKTTKVKTLVVFKGDHVESFMGGGGVCIITNPHSVVMGSP
jgi:hypothetical protein